MRARFHLVELRKGREDSGRKRVDLSDAWGAREKSQDETAWLSRLRT